MASGEDGGPGRALHILHFGHGVVLRSRGVARLVRALLACLGAHLERERQGDHVLLHAVAFTGSAGAVVLPALRRRELEARLGALGLRQVDGPHVRVDLDSAEVVVERTLDVDEHVLAEIDERWRSPARERQPAPAGRYPLRALGLPSATSLTPAAALLYAMPLAVLPDSMTTPDALHALAALVESVEIVDADDTGGIVQDANLGSA